MFFVFATQINSIATNNRDNYYTCMTTNKNEKYYLLNKQYNLCSFTTLVSVKNQETRVKPINQPTRINNRFFKNYKKYTYSAMDIVTKQNEWQKHVHYKQFFFFKCIHMRLMLYMLFTSVNQQKNKLDNNC